MLVLITTRCLQAAVVLLGVSLVVFVLVRIVPGDPVRLLVGEQATPEMVAEARQAWGLDRPIPVQYLLYLRAWLRADLGWSIRQQRPVGELVLERIPASLELAVVALAIAVGLGVPIGILAATRMGRVSDLAATAVTLVGQSLPTFWWGILLILVFAVRWRLLPTSGRGSLVQLVLPSVTVATYITALIARLTRSCVLEELRQDYVRTAMSKGLSGARIVWRHVLRNAAIPVLTIIGIQIGNLLGGAVITETIFAWPGLGTL